jgi:peptide-methionine (S)-S-oxide reductase
MNIATILISALSLLMFSKGCEQEGNTKNEIVTSDNIAEPTQDFSNLDTATFAGGCFWCVEASFEQIKGVIEAISGFAGGSKVNPTYKEVSGGYTDHTETVQVYYDPQEISYEDLLKAFFLAHDPTQLNRQGPDVGPQYRGAIFYHNKAQLQKAKAAIADLDLSIYSGDQVVTELNPYNVFYPAEAYHQDFEERNPNHPYILQVSKPKIERVAKAFSDRLK